MKDDDRLEPSTAWTRSTAAEYRYNLPHRHDADNPKMPAQSVLAALSLFNPQTWFNHRVGQQE